MINESGLEDSSPGPADRAISVAEIPGLRELWAETKGDPRITIAVLDGPVDRAHPSLAGATLEIVEGLAPAAPMIGGLATRHGTQVASLIFGQHWAGSTVKGVAPQCRGLLVPIFRDSAPNLASRESLACAQLDLARALLLAAEQGADVINVSGGEFTPSGEAHPILAGAVRRCAGRGILIVAAAGNEGCECLHVPAALPGVLAVGAMTLDGEPLESSNWGRGYRSTGLLAPGANLRTAIPGGDFEAATGTSYATAVVSGVIGLLLSYAKARGFRQNGQAAGHFLLDTALKCLDDSMRCRRRLAGRLDLTKAALVLPVKVQPMNDKSSLNTADGHIDEASEASDATSAPRVHPAPGVVVASGECGCASCQAKANAQSYAPGSLVFSLGQLGYDLISEARRDSLRHHIQQLRTARAKAQETAKEKEKGEGERVCSRPSPVTATITVGLGAGIRSP
jgi:subtilisin family serine protease